MPKKPSLGFGLGLRTEHYETILTEKPNIDWFEILTENYLVPGGKPHFYLDKIRKNYPMVMHGVSMSIGSTDPIYWQYLKDLKSLAKRIQPEWISDHLCWTGIHQKNTHDLLPLPYTEECIAHIVNRIKQIQDFLGQQILIENVSSYITYNQSALTEWQFLNEIARQADCLILLDINNIYVSSVNHEFNPLDYLGEIDVDRVCQIHLAGHSNYNAYIIDTHDNDIVDAVWDLYVHALYRFGPVATMIERDDNIPPLADLMLELDHARYLVQNTLKEKVYA